MCRSLLANEDSSLFDVLRSTWYTCRHLLLQVRASSASTSLQSRQNPPPRHRCNNGYSSHPWFHSWVGGVWRPSLTDIPNSIPILMVDFLFLHCSPHNYTTQCTKVLLQEQTVTQLIKKFSIFYGKQRLITVLIQLHVDTNPQPHGSSP